MLHMRNNFFCMSSFPVNIPVKPALFSFGLGDKDNQSFQPNLDVTLPKWVISKLATNYLPALLFQPFQVNLNLPLLLIKISPMFLATSLCDKTSCIFVSHVLRKEGNIHIFTLIFTFPEDLLCCIYSLTVFWMQEEKTKRRWKEWEVAVGTSEPATSQNRE